MRTHVPLLSFGSPRRARSVASATLVAVIAVAAPLAGCADGSNGNDFTTASGKPTAPAAGGPASTGPTLTPGTHTPLPGFGGTASAPWTGEAPKGSVPVTGGTLLVTADGQTAVASDPDRDQVALVDLPSRTLLAQIRLPTGSEPGRLVEDGSGRVHVLLRRGGGVADIDLFSHQLVGLRQTCALPRGVAYRPTGDTLLVSCLTGDLLTLAADPQVAQPIARAKVHDADGTVLDLRDVLVHGANVFVTTFRSATVLQVDATGAVVGNRIALNTRVDTSAAQLEANGLTGGTPQNFVPAVAWRTVLGPSGDLVVVHQGGSDRVINVAADSNGGTQTPVSTSCSSSEYGGETCTTTSGTPICTPPILIGAVSSVSDTGVVSDGPALPNGALPVDITPTKDGASYVVALAGNPGGALAADGTPMQNVVIVPAVDPSAGAAGNAARFDADLCGSSFTGSGVSVPGQVTAVAVDGNGQIVAQTREPATLQLLTSSGPVAIQLSAKTVSQEGFNLFHTNTGRGMTCAGCHAEGGDDGRTWKFTDGFDASGNPVEVKARRTQTFRQGFLSTAPFHWDGEFPGMSDLMNDVFVHRMAAVAPTPLQQTELEQWMNDIPPKMHDAPDATLAASIARGKALFEDPKAACSACHSGASFTNNKSADIGFGVALQVPTLVDIAFRGPFLHDGSVPTLTARFSDPTAKSGLHGSTSNLSASQIADLVSYMESL